MVEMAAGQYPDVAFIVPHLGGFSDDWMTHLAVIDQLCRYPNVFADTSGVRYFDALVEAVRRAGPRKLLFGSDGPLLHPGVELEKVRALGLSAEAASLVAGRTTRAGRGPRPRHSGSRRHSRPLTRRLPIVVLEELR